MLIGALEAGGTKMVCAVGSEKGEIREQISIPTNTPDETLPQIAEYFRKHRIEALGIGCFGPIDLRRESPTYGFITSTPKAAWRGCDIVGYFKKELSVAVGFDTDVNASLLGEAAWGAAKDLDSAIYITIGTGIGVGVMAEGRLLHGMLHPEAGHIMMLRHEKDAYEGKCPYHKCCFEGLAAGPALEERWGKKGAELAGKREVWEMEAYYIAQAIYSYILTLSPQRIILGGGVMKQEILFSMIREEVLRLNKDYINTKEMEKIEEYIVPAALGGDQGIMGCIRLALEEMR
ncbi:MAG: ROK family protein [Johnsonella sp.]|nr:ROK family protein [Johnsonella sp.]